MRRRRVMLPRSVECHIPLLYLRTFGGWGLLRRLTLYFIVLWHYCLFLFVFCALHRIGCGTFDTRLSDYRHSSFRECGRGALSSGQCMRPSLSSDYSGMCGFPLRRTRSGCPHVAKSFPLSASSSSGIVTYSQALSAFSFLL